jgi:hypothetical protein
VRYHSRSQWKWLTQYARTAPPQKGGKKLALRSG